MHLPHQFKDSPPSQVGDYALMAAIRVRDEGALAELYDRYAGLVYAVCLRTLGDAGEAEDLLIDIFWELWERGERYDPQRGKPVSHILGLTRSRAIDRLRVRRTAAHIRGEEIGEEAVAQESVSNTPPAAAALAEERERVRRALSNLADEQREVLELAFFNAKSHSEIARSLGQPLGTVKSRIRQAMINLRSLLEGPEPRGKTPVPVHLSRRKTGQSCVTSRTG